MDHQPNRECRTAAEHPGIFAIEHEARDAGTFEQVTRHPHLGRIDAGEDLNQFRLIDGSGGIFRIISSHRNNFTPAQRCRATTISMPAPP
jgi:hypothetical protein